MYVATVVCSSLGTLVQENHSIKNRPLHHKYTISLGVVCFRVYLSTNLNVPSELKFTVLQSMDSISLEPRLSFVGGYEKEPGFEARTL